MTELVPRISGKADESGLVTAVSGVPYYYYIMNLFIVKQISLSIF